MDGWMDGWMDGYYVQKMQGRGQCHAGLSAGMASSLHEDKGTDRLARSLEHLTGDGWCGRMKTPHLTDSRKIVSERKREMICQIISLLLCRKIDWQRHHVQGMRQRSSRPQRWRGTAPRRWHRRRWAC